jgi:hypothetical protein
MTTCAIGCKAAPSNDFSAYRESFPPFRSQLGQREDPALRLLSQTPLVPPLPELVGLSNRGIVIEQYLLTGRACLREHTDMSDDLGPIGLIRASPPGFVGLAMPPRSAHDARRAAPEVANSITVFPNLVRLDWERTLEALTAIVVLAFLLERAAAFPSGSRSSCRTSRLSRARSGASTLT